MGVFVFLMDQSRKGDFSPREKRKDEPISRKREAEEGHIGREKEKEFSQSRVREGHS